MKNIYQELKKIEFELEKRNFKLNYYSDLLRISNIREVEYENWYACVPFFKCEYFIKNHYCICTYYAKEACMGFINDKPFYEIKFYTQSGLRIKEYRFLVLSILKKYFKNFKVEK